MKSADEVLGHYLLRAPLALACVRAAEAGELRSPFGLKTPGGELLDLCCGFGEFASAFFEGPVGDGLDIFKEDVARASRSTLYHRLVSGDARRLPYAENTFAGVLSVSALEHIPGVDVAIHEIFRVLKPGGRLVFTVPTETINEHFTSARLLGALGLKSLRRAWLARLHATFVHNNIWPSIHWEDLCRNAGFSHVGVRPVMTARQLLLHDLGLYPALISQCVRWATGMRTVLPFPFRRRLDAALFSWACRGEKTEGVIMVTADKGGG